MYLTPQNQRQTLRRTRLEAAAKTAYSTWAERVGGYHPAFEQLPVAEWHGWVEVAARLKSAPRSRAAAGGTA